MKHVKLTRETIRAMDKLRAKNKAYRLSREERDRKLAFETDVERAAISTIECACGHPEKRHYLPSSGRGARTCFVLERDRETNYQMNCPCVGFTSMQPWGTPKLKRTDVRVPREPSKPKVITIQEAISEPLTRLGKRKIDL